MYAADEYDCSYSPFVIGAFCPLLSLAPGRRLNIGEAFAALPLSRIHLQPTWAFVFRKAERQ